MIKLTATFLAFQRITVQSVSIVEAYRPVRMKLSDTGKSVILQSM